MRKILTLLVASTALTAAIEVPAWSAMHAPVDRGPQPFAARFEDRAQALRVILANEDDEVDDRLYRENSLHGHDDDIEANDDDDDCDDDDDDDCRDGAESPAPADTAAPPQNGLFGNGALPQVQVN